MVDNITSGNTTLFSGKSQTLKQSNDNDGPRGPGCLAWTYKKFLEWLNRIMGPQPSSDGV